jgi:NitT/TauT family transport system substrate-binding protein
VLGRTPQRLSTIVLAFAIFAFAVPTRAGSQTLPTLRVAASVSDAFAEGSYAVDMGFFKKAGLNVDLQLFANGTASTIAVATGAADIGITSPVNLAPAFIRGVPFTLIAGGSLYTTNAPVDILCVAKDSPFKNATDLEGKTIGVAALNDIMQIAALAWLSEHGAAPSKVRFVELPYPQMGAALARGTVDAAVIPEPSLTDARDKGLVRDFGKVYDAISTQFMNGAWFTTMSFAQKNPDVIKRFRVAIYDAGSWANKNHDRSAEILAKHSKINVQTARTMTRSLYSDSLTAQSVQPALDAAFKYGLIQRPVNAGDMIFHGPPEGVR